MAKSDRVQKSIDRLRVSCAAFHNQRRREHDDLAFLVDPWPDDVKQQRAAITVAGVPIPARPMLSVATLDEPISLQENLEKQASLGVNIHPLNEEADDDTAEVLQGLYRRIEVDSRAGNARSWAYARSLRAGLGAYRVIKEYDLDTGVPGDQKLVIKRILYQSNAYPDPFAQEPDWSDAEWWHVIEDMSFAKYKVEFPDSDLAAFDDDSLIALGNETNASEEQAGNDAWVGGEGPESRTVRIAEYFYKEHTPERIELKGAAHDGSDLRITVDKPHVIQVKHNAIEELEVDDNWGRYIPIIPTIGCELQPYDKERRWIGMVRPAKDGARLTNYAASNAVELAALDPKAPYTMDPQQIEGFESWWQQANLRNWPYLPFRRFIDGQDFGKPERTQTDVARLSPSMQLLAMGKDFVQAATATYDPALGKQPTAHRSGRAIVALQDQTIEGNSHYLDNLAEVSMTYEAMVVLDLMAIIYDRPGRIARILDERGNMRQVALNAPFVPGQSPKQRPQLLQTNEQNQPILPANVARESVQHYDLSKGRYGVTINIGKSYKSRLMQGADDLTQIISADPQLLPIIGPEWIKFKDIPGGNQIADMLKKMREHQFPFLSDNAPGTPNPQQVAQIMAENQALKAAMGQAQMEAQAKIAQTREQNAGKMAIAQIQESAESDRAAADREVKLAVAELTAKQERMELFIEEVKRLGVQSHEVNMAVLQHLQDMRAAQQAGQINAQQSAQDHGQAMQQQVNAAALQPPPSQPSGDSANA